MFITCTQARLRACVCVIVLIRGACTQFMRTSLRGLHVFICLLHSFFSCRTRLQMLVLCVVAALCCSVLCCINATQNNETDNQRNINNIRLATRVLRRVVQVLVLCCTEINTLNTFVLPSYTCIYYYNILFISNFLPLQFCSVRLVVPGLFLVGTVLWAVCRLGLQKLVSICMLILYLLAARVRGTHRRRR